MKFRLTAIALFLLGITLPLGAELCRAENETPAPIHIEADRMESHDQGNAVLFTGHVEARQGDITITGDEMTVFYANSLPAAEKEPAENSAKKMNQGGNALQQVKKIFAKGHVKIIKGDWVASGDMMEFFSTERKVLLSGNAKAWQDKNMVSGDSISLFLDEGKSIVERSPQQDGNRVKAFIYPGAPDDEMPKTVD